MKEPVTTKFADLYSWMALTLGSCLFVIPVVLADEKITSHEFYYGIIAVSYALIVGSFGYERSQRWKNK